MYCCSEKRHCNVHIGECYNERAIQQKEGEREREIYIWLKSRSIYTASEQSFGLALNNYTDDDHIRQLCLDSPNCLHFRKLYGVA